MSNILKYQNPSSPLLIQRVNKSNANFVKRLLDPDRESIPDWETKGQKIATHKMSWGEDEHGAYVFPEVQEIDGQLIDFSRPPYAFGIADYMAHKNNNIIRMSPEEADWFTRNYKQYYPSFKKGGRIHIKKKNRGKFTEYCGGKVTEECIARGKRSKNPLTRKRANFASVVRKWKHATGGPLGRPNFKESKEAYYDPETDTIFAPDSLGEFYHHEMFHARPNLQLLESLKPYYHNLNDDVLKQMGADLSFVKKFNNDPGYFYSPEELGARVVSASEMLNKMGVKNVTVDFLKNARLNENVYGDNFRDLLHMYNDKNLIKIFNVVKKHENGGILKAQGGTENNFWSKLWNAVKAGGMMARDAKLGAVGAQQVRDLYSEGKNQEAQDLAKQYAKANTTGIALAGGAASTGLLGDLMVTGATTAADTFVDGDTENFGKNLALNTAFDLAGHGAGKLLKNVDWGKVRNGVELIPNTKANVSEYINTIDDALPERQPLTIRKSSQFWDGTSKSKLSVDEKMGLPKSERNQPIKSNPNAGAVTNVDTYLINRSYAPWEIRDGKFIFKMGEPINVRGLSERAPITFHFTTDTQVKPHSGGDSWANAKTTYLVPYKSVVKHNGMPANIEPMDTWWTAGSTFEFPTQDVKVLTVDPKVYRQYKARGIDVEFSPEGRKLVRERKGMSDIVEQWIRNKQDQFGMRPTVDTYRQMERETGLPSNVRPKKKHLFGDYFEETNIPDYHTGPATHSNSWSFPAMANIGLPDDPKYFMSSIARNVALDLSKYKTFTFKDLPALQKLAQTHKQFDIQLPTTYGVKNEYSWDFSGQEELVDKINKILRGEIVVPYEQGGKL